MMINSVGLFGQTYYEDTRDYLEELISLINKQGWNLIVEENYHKQLKEAGIIDVALQTFSKSENLKNKIHLLFTIGGDGTILRAITYIKNSGVPILGINTGRLGFLATVQKAEVKKAFECLLKEEFYITERVVLQVSTFPKNSDLADNNFALNEISVARQNTASMIGIETHLDQTYLTNYFADGLIVATPTGSTGYSLSCGGPVIDPKSNSLVITPIAPHNLNARPLIISNDTSIDLKVEGRIQDFLLSLDSRLISVSANSSLCISKAPFTIPIISLKDRTFYETLRSKLLWGEDTRNHK